MVNFGRIDMTKLERLAASSGIATAELHQALEARRMLDVAFCTASR